MKKVMLWIMVVVCVMVSVEAVFAASMEALAKEMETFADRIAAYNKPVFEAKLTRKERQFYEDESPSTSPVLWNRVYAKDKTLVLAAATKNKNFKAVVMKTNDPDFAFSGLRVGASTEAIERLFGTPINKLGHKKGNKVIVYGPDMYPTDYLPSTVSILCENGIITEFIYDVGGPIYREGDLSGKAVEFAERKSRQMNLSSINGAQPTYFNGTNLFTFLDDPEKSQERHYKGLNK